MWWLVKRWQRSAHRKRPFPAEWFAFLERNVPYYRRLSEPDRRELESHILVFVAEKSFEGCGGLVMTDEIKVTIAAQACVLLLHRDADYYPELDSVLVYPDTYVVTRDAPGPGGVVVQSREHRLGESWGRGVVVLAWNSVLSGAHDLHDGENVILHEFAHQLDQEDGDGDGAPVLEHSSMYVPWARVLGAEYERLVRDDARSRKTVMNKYGATNPAEFFAVVTETFFEKPEKLRRKHPELYEQLKLYYRQDPASAPRPQEPLS